MKRCGGGDAAGYSSSDSTSTAFMLLVWSLDGKRRPVAFVGRSLPVCVSAPAFGASGQLTRYR